MSVIVEGRVPHHRLAERAATELHRDLRPLANLSPLSSLARRNVRVRRAVALGLGITLASPRDTALVRWATELTIVRRMTISLGGFA